MSTISQMKLICEILEKEGYGNTYLEANHDIIYLLEEYETLSDEVIVKINNLGASDDGDGMMVVYL